MTDSVPPTTSSDLRLPVPENSEFCGPDQLCRVILMLRRWDKAKEMEAAITEPALRRLLDLCFQVSLTTEEGRHPRFRIYVPGTSATGSPRQVMRFDPRLQMSDQILRRIAPSISSRTHALQIVEHEKKLFADAIIGIGESEDSIEPGSHDVSAGVGIPGLMVRVDGPGILRVTEKRTWELRAGRIQPVDHYGKLKIVRDWFSELAESFLEQTGSLGASDAAAIIAMALAAEKSGWSAPPVVAPEATEDSSARAPDAGSDRRDAAAIFDSVWSFVLTAAISSNHGGAFVILPQGVKSPVKVTYTADQLDLMRAALRFWESCYDPDAVNDPVEAQTRQRRWDAARRRMFSAARALADLANVDGCVVLDRKLRLTGFGGEIRVHDNDIPGWRCTGADTESLAEEEPIELERFGTRHRSAARLCAAVPGTIAYVVSQDGDLRVFYGMKDRRVCMWRNLGAWMSALERW